MISSYPMAKTCMEDAALEIFMCPNPDFCVMGMGCRILHPQES